MWSLDNLFPQTQRSFLGDTILELAAVPRLRSSNSDNWGLTILQNISTTHHAEHQCKDTSVEVANMRSLLQSLKKELSSHMGILQYQLRR